MLDLAWTPENHPPPRGLACLPEALGAPGPASVLQHPVLKAHHKLLWLRLAEAAAESGATLPANIIASAAGLAAQLGENERNVRRWLSDLVESGLVELVDRQPGRSSHLLLLDPAEAVPGWKVRTPSPQLELFESNEQRPPESEPSALRVAAPPATLVPKMVAPPAALVPKMAAREDGHTSIPACAPFLVVVRNFNNNNVKGIMLDREDEIVTLAHGTYSKVFSGRPPKIDDLDRALMIRLAFLAVVEWGPDWLAAATKAKPPGGGRANNPMAFFRAAAAYHAWEHLVGSRPETAADRDEARQSLAGVLSALTVPSRLLSLWPSDRPPPPQPPDTTPPDPETYETMRDMEKRLRAEGKL